MGNNHLLLLVAFVVFVAVVASPAPQSSSSSDVAIPESLTVLIKDLLTKTAPKVAANKHASLCFDNPAVASRLARVLGDIQLPEDDACQLLASYGVCDSPLKGLFDVICPASCGMWDDDSTIVSLAQSIAPSANIDSCSMLPSFLGTDAAGVCFSSQFGKYIRRYCPCLCQESILAFIGIPSEKVPCEPWKAFFDSFDEYSEGMPPVGPNWMESSSSPVVNGQGQLCGLDRNFVPVRGSCEMPSGLQFQFNFQAAAVEGFQAYITLLSEDQSRIALFGCSGTSPGVCTPLILTANLQADGSLVFNEMYSQSPVPIAVNTSYQFVVSGNGMGVSWTMGPLDWTTGAASEFLVQMTESIDLEGFTFAGVDIGLGGVAPSCIDDFSMATLD